jgi:hypothetical protein
MKEDADERRCMKESAVKVQVKPSPFPPSGNNREKPAAERQANGAIAAGGFFDFDLLLTFDLFLTWTGAWRKALAYRLPARPPQATPLK